jgi:hypothetical protein
MKFDSNVHFLPTPLQAFALVVSRRLGLRQDFLIKIGAIMDVEKDVI